MKNYGGINMFEENIIEADITDPFVEREVFAVEQNVFAQPRHVFPQSMFLIALEAQDIPIPEPMGEEDDEDDN